MKKILCIIVGLLVIVDLIAGRSSSSSHESGKPEKIDDSESDSTGESSKKSSSSEEGHCTAENKTIGKEYHPVQQNCTLNVTGLNLDVDNLLTLVTAGIIKPQKYEVKIKLKTSVDVQNLCIRVWSKDKNCKGLIIKVLKIANCNALLHLKMIPSKLCLLAALVIEVRAVDLKALNKSKSGSPQLVPIKKLLDEALKQQCSNKTSKESSEESKIPKLLK